MSPSIPQIAAGPAIIVEPTLEQRITLHLENESFGLRDIDIFEGPMPDGKPYTLGACIAVLEVGGALSPDAGGNDAPDRGLLRVSVQVRSDANSYTAGKKRAEQVCAALHKIDLGGDALSVFAGTPIYTKVDRKGRHHWSINLTIQTYGVR